MKKTVIFIDLYPNEGHYEFNNGIVELFVKYYDVTILSPHIDYLNFNNKNKVKELYDKKILAILKTNKSILKFVKLFFHFFSINRIVNNKEYDFVYVLTFNNIHLFLFLLTIKQNVLKKTYFNVHNNFSNIARKTIRLERFLFLSYKNKLNFVCNAPFIFEALVKHDIGLRKLYLLRSPKIVYNLQNKNKSSLKFKFDSILISSSNDPDLINRLIGYEKSTNYLSSNKLKLLARSNTIGKISSIETISENWIPKSKILDLLQSTWSVGLFFYNDYYMRNSSSLIEALSNGKIVFANRTDITNYYARVYPKIVIIVESELDFFEQLKYYKENFNQLDVEENFELFNTNNSNEIIAHDLKMLFERHSNYLT